MNNMVYERAFKLMDGENTERGYVSPRQTSQTEAKNVERKIADPMQTRKDYIEMSDSQYNRMVCEGIM